MLSPPYLSLCNDTPTSEPYTLSLHDALPIFALVLVYPPVVPVAPGRRHLGVVLAALELLGVEDGRHVLLDHVRRQPQRRLDQVRRGEVGEVFVPDALAGVDHRRHAERVLDHPPRL